MAKKEKPTAKKADTTTKKSETDSGKAKKGGKERFKGKGKWTGSCGDGDDLGAELAALGLRIKDITGDGNCFFRALGDQLQGDERQHVQLRQRVVSYILDNRDDFAPFVEDDESFDSYVARMKKDGVWAGYMEVVAASRSLGANLTIYQAGQPRWHVINHPEGTAPMLHLSYHDGQHYNSVRCADDYGAGPPAPVVIRGDGTVAAARRFQRPEGDGIWDERDERRVVTSTACTDMALVRKALEEARGDVDAAIEKVIDKLAAAEEQPPAAEELYTTVQMMASTVVAEPSPPALPGAATRGPPPWAEAADATRTDRTGPPGDMADRAAASAVCSGGGGYDGGGGGGSSASGGSRANGADADADAGPCTEIGAYGDSGGAAARQCTTESLGPLDGSVTAAAGCNAPAGGSAPAGGAAAAAAAAERAASLPSAAAISVRVGDTRVAGAKATSRRTAPAGAAGVAAPANNKRCPCGSKMKYKACCGPAAAAALRRRAATGPDPDAAAAAGGSITGGTAFVAQVAALVI